MGVSLMGRPPGIPWHPLSQWVDGRLGRLGSFWVEPSRTFREVELGGLPIYILSYRSVCWFWKSSCMPSVLTYDRAFWPCIEGDERLV